MTLSAEELRWGFASADGMPYVDVKEQQLLGGVIYQLGQLASQKLGFTAAFVETPNKRIDEYMQRGRIHVICNNNPQWMEQPERYHWSEALYDEEDVLLLNNQHPPVLSLHDLYGKTIGTQLGYIYNADLMAAFADQKIMRQDLRDHHAGFNLLIKQRLDAIIDMRRPLLYQMAKHADAPLHLNAWAVERYSMYCTYSPKLPVTAEQLDKVLKDLRNHGTIEQLLKST
ncbi:ABC transporter substrate-binding protein [Pseudomonas sp. HMWF032]|uniref:substrate-binding periplasmic protein n=1 Tax=unclassified Pseudomonas TaxID=196821 RepID=UPI000D3A003D|nr:MULTISPECIES: transporter substrate-binding domain-containing protein [unclassified Pseudomonas]PTS84440.1 ABC transporter substrate-binding protein [Pseudomonas sp. HMWF032]PTT83923.1 ABC transporter substrate-binding protein [Pseudomonas sp. HMWF010]WAC44438.1 transporter substrate-binding domain-containing protein [Pseudomonas sp. SL4(2022)]